ncbi:hypothetical protein ABPG77_002241 [Micractinium sp. CCAP 211/92]
MEGGFLPEPETRAASASSWDLQLADQRSLQPPRAAVQARAQPWGSAGSGGTAAPPGRFADGPPDNEGLLEAQGGCSRCPSLSFNSEWLRAFGVVLCNECKRSERLISKSTAKQRYSVGDADLSRLGSLRKANPHKKDWQAMHLYMESQVARLAHDKHGGAEGLQQHQQARQDKQLEGRLKRRAEEKRKEAEEAARLARIRQRIEQEARRVAEEGAAASGSDGEEEI